MSCEKKHEIEFQYLKESGNRLSGSGNKQDIQSRRREVFKPITMPGFWWEEPAEKGGHHTTTHKSGEIKWNWMI